MNNNNNIPKEPDFSWLFKDVTNEKPELKAGQLWTIFHHEIENEEKDETETGQIVLIMEIDGSNIFIVPVHATESTRTILDPLIPNEFHNLHPYPIVAVVTMAQNIGTEPFKTARFVGEIAKEGVEIIEESYSKFLNAIDELATVQYKDAHEIELTDDEEEAATKAGIYKLCPVNGDIDSLIEFNDEISEILEPWHILAMAELFAKEKVKHIDEVAEPKVAHSFFQKVTSKIKIIFNDSVLGDISLMAAGEAEKADHTIPIKKEYKGMKLEFQIVIRPDKNDKNFTCISIDGKASTFLRDKNVKVTLVFENNLEESFVFDNESRKVWKFRNQNAKISSISVLLI
ncbi:MAG: hypothetical protein ACOX2F_06030 [bacterium]